MKEGKNYFPFRRTTTLGLGKIIFPVWNFDQYGAYTWRDNYPTGKKKYPLSSTTRSRWKLLRFGSRIRRTDVIIALRKPFFARAAAMLQKVYDSRIFSFRSQPVQSQNFGSRAIAAHYLWSQNFMALELFLHFVLIPIKTNNLCSLLNILIWIPLKPKMAARVRLISLNHSQYPYVSAQ